MSFKKAVDIDYVSTTRISHYTYVITRVVLNTSASIIINLHSDSDPHFFKHIEMTIEGDEYRSWGADDSYISNLIDAKVGLFLSPKLAEQAVAPVTEEVAAPVAEPAVAPVAEVKE